MRVYFSGSHSCGKSTLARWTAEQYNLPLIPEVARMVLSEKELQIDSLRSDIETVNAYQKAVFNRQLEEEKKAAAAAGFVSDRNILDCLSYTASHATIFSSLMKDKRLSSYVSSLKEKDAFVFFVRPAKGTLKNDGVRENVSWDGVIAIDAQIKLLLELFEVRYFQISAESMQERIRLVEAVLRNQ